MTYRQMQDEIIALRFNGTTPGRTQVKSWLNARYAAIWGMHDWHFKHVTEAPLLVTASDRTPSMPSDFAKTESLVDQNGDRLRWLEPEDYRDLYANQTSTGAPCDYTVIDREIWLGPIPQSAQTYKLSYARRLSIVSGASGLVAGGILTADADQTIWGAEYDYLLVVDSMLLGQQLTGDPWADSLIGSRDELLTAMVVDLVGGQDGEIVQWGGPSHGSGGLWHGGY